MKQKTCLAIASPPRALAETTTTQTHQLHSTELPLFGPAFRFIGTLSPGSWLVSVLSGPSFLVN